LKKPHSAKADNEPPIGLDIQALRVLIVDDNEINCDVLQCQLDSWNVSSDSALSGEQALEMLRAATESGNAYDLAILDRMMPGMDGLELARRIRQDDSLASLVLIMLSGDLEGSSHPGIDAHLTKPVTQSQLYNTIGTLMHGRPCAKSALPRRSAPVKAEFVPILLAEDNPTNQHVCLEMLERLGYRCVDVVSNGLEAMQRLSYKHYGLILMDCQMPELDGYETARLIRKKESLCASASRTFIVALTAHAMKGAREQCLASGMDDYLSKPFTLDQLEATLDRWLPLLGADDAGCGLEIGCAVDPWLTGGLDGQSIDAGII
jgi:CheY-like chemotaxis protein